MRYNVLTPDSKAVSPEVSVLILTYNHERFIAQAIESVLAQVADFDYEIVIGDDCSKDGTSAIIRSFQKKYPNRIRIRRSEPNLGMGRNFAFAFSLCRGRYIALLEGDDYWTASDKLQVQADALDAHPDWALNFHRVKMIDPANPDAADMPIEAPAVVTTEDLLEENKIPTCSVMFRRSALKKLPCWCLLTKVLDWPLFVLLTQHGNAGLISETMAAYRIHSSGLWSRKSQKERSEAIADLFTFFHQHLDKKFSPLIRQRRIEAYAHIALCDEENGNLGAAIKANWRAMILNFWGGHEQRYHLLRLLAKVTAPSIYSTLQRMQAKRLPSVVPASQTNAETYPANVAASASLGK